MGGHQCIYHYECLLFAACRLSRCCSQWQFYCQDVRHLHLQLHLFWWREVQVYSWSNISHHWGWYSQHSCRDLPLFQHTLCSGTTVSKYSCEWDSCQLGLWLKSSCPWNIITRWVRQIIFVPYIEHTSSSIVSWYNHLIHRNSCVHHTCFSTTYTFSDNFSCVCMYTCVCSRWSKWWYFMFGIHCVFIICYQPFLIEFDAKLCRREITIGFLLLLLFPT